MHKENALAVIRKLLGASCSFAVYRLPGEKEFRIVVNSQANGNDPKEGSFVIAPFQVTSSQPVVSIIPEFSWTSGTSVEGFMVQIQNLPPKSVEKHNFQSGTTHRQYQDYFEAFHNAFLQGELKKAILSCVNTVQTADPTHPARYFMDLIKAYPSAFVFLVHTEQYGTWLGATPEVLLGIENNLNQHDGWLLTTALAGTKLPDKKNQEWTAKEHEEHAFVREFLEGRLSEAGYQNPEINGPYSQRAGAVTHLRTDYKYHFTERHNWLNLALQLHPTPAVGGTPRDKAIELINKVEKHERRLYTGFLGPWNLAGKTSFYVNLRCCQVFRHAVTYHIGGGLTLASSEQQEWDETRWKMETLRAILED